MTRELRQAAVAQATVGFAVAALGGSLVLLARDLGAPVAALAWLSSTFGAGLLIVGLAARPLLRRGPQPLLAAAALAAAAGAALLAAGPFAALAGAGGLLLGLGSAGLVLVTPALLRAGDRERHLSLLTGIASAAGIAAPLGLAAGDALGPSGRLALLLLVGPLVVLAVTARARRPAEAAATPVPAAPLRAPTPLVARRWVAIVLAVSVEFCFVVWSVARLQDTGLTPAAATATSTAFVAGMAAGRIGAARAAALPGIVTLCCAVVAAATVLVAATGSAVGAAIGLAVAGMAVALLYPVTLSRLMDLLPADRGSGLGAIASGTAVLLAPAALGLLAGVVELRAAFLIAVLPLAGALAAVDRRGAAESKDPLRAFRARPAIVSSRRWRR